MREFNLKISTPSKIVYDGKAVFLLVRGSEGDLAILAGHVPFVTSVIKGKCKIRLPDGTERNAECGGGLLTVGKDSVNFLTSSFD